MISSAEKWKAALKCAFKHLVVSDDDDLALAPRRPRHKKRKHAALDMDRVNVSWFVMC